VKKGPIKPVRCAIYTRVSTDHGLEQDFNSLETTWNSSTHFDVFPITIPVRVPLAAVRLNSINVSMACLIGLSAGGVGGTHRARRNTASVFLIKLIRSWRAVAQCIVANPFFG
jgi:hypothetical protein